MSLINATILIQAANFGITYLLVRRLLLRPVVTTIQEEMQAQQMVITELSKQKQALMSCEQELEVWRNWCCEQFSQRSPNPEKIFLYYDYKMAEIKYKGQYSPHDLQEQEKALVKAIVKKVMHVKL